MAIDNSDPWRTVLGTSFVDGREVEIALSMDDLKKPTWILGRSGRGKSSLLFSIAVSLMQQGLGVGVVDPHGDLAEDLLNALPSSRVRDLIYMDPTTADVVTFNPVACVPPPRIAAQAANVLAAFKAVWGDSWGPRLERILYSALAALIEAPATTLVGLPRFLKDERYRAAVLRHCSNPIVLDFFRAEFASWDRDYRAAALDPVLNKAEQLLVSDDVRATLGTVTSSIDFPTILDEGKVLVANLGKGRLGPLHANLLGASLVSSIQSAAFERATTHVGRERQQFTLIIDEVQSFSTQSFAEILSESRKYGLAIIAGCQYTSQMPHELRDAFLGNVGNLITFEVSAEDAELIGLEIGLRKQAVFLLTELKVGEAWMRHARYGGPLHVYIYEPPKGNARWRTTALKQNALRHAYPRERIEEKLGRFLAR
jgi:hypothetical protein